MKLLVPNLTFELEKVLGASQDSVAPGKRSRNEDSWGIEEMFEETDCNMESDQVVRTGLDPDNPIDERCE